MKNEQMPVNSDLQTPSSREVFSVFLLLGLTSFGGPVAHLAYFRKELIQKRMWLTEEQYAQLIAICQFLPGPASSQVGFALGLFRAGWQGALAAFTAFTLPSVILLIAFASLLPAFPHAFTDLLVHGLKLVACVVVIDAVWGMYQKLCTDKLTQSIAILGACFVLWVDTLAGQLVLILMSATMGFAFCKSKAGASDISLPNVLSIKQSVWMLGLFLVLFLILPLLGAVFEWAAIAEGFYQAGALVFGGGHVVLPWLEAFLVAPGLVNADDFLAGYGAAQAVPGPLFTFSAYLGALLGEGLGAVVMALVCIVAIFLPGFLLLLAFLPLWQKVSSEPRAANVLAGVNAGVVGILAAVLYDPIFTSSVNSNIDMAILLFGLLLLKIAKMPVLWVVMTMILTTFITL